MYPFRLQAAGQALLDNLDVKLDYCPSFASVYTGESAPCYVHNAWDLCDVGWRFVEALHLTRRALGQVCMDPRETALRERVFATLREDGLSYRPGYAWDDGTAWMWDQGRALIALCSLAEGGDEAERCLGTARRMLETLDAIALRGSNGLPVYPFENWDGKQWGTEIIGHPPTGLQLEGAARFYALTGEEKFLDYARRVARQVVEQATPILDRDGKFIQRGGGENLTLKYTHIHSRLAILYGLYLTGKALGESVFMDYARRGYETALGFSLSYGWVPECLERLGPYRDGDAGEDERQANALDEVCCLMDMIKWGLLQGSEGQANSYDLAERFAVNGVFAHQLVEPDRLADYMSTSPIPQHAPGQVDARDLPARFFGMFNGAQHAHQFWRQYGSPYPIMVPSGCCSPAGTTALALLSLDALTERGGGGEGGNVLSVNAYIPVSRPHARLTVDPGNGRFTLMIAKPFTGLRLRQPDWAKGLPLHLTHRGKPVKQVEKNGWIHIERPPVGVLEGHFPTTERQTNEPWCGGRLEATWLGNKVMAIDTDHEIRSPLFPLLPVFQRPL